MFNWLRNRRWIVGGAITFSVAFGLLVAPVMASMVNAQAESDGESVVYACQSKRTGKLRIKEPGKCSKREISLVWQVQGPQGPQGPLGPDGRVGPQGPTGPDGEVGPGGERGLLGTQGPQGQPGPQGSEGPVGLQGPPGTGAEDAWSVFGNDSTTAGTSFLGTTDDQPLEFRVGNVRVFLLEPTLGSPNIIAGDSDNQVLAGASGATISGGGPSNRVSDDFGTVSGGLNNQVGDGTIRPDTARYATVGGGRDNTARGESATVGGGSFNTASDPHTTIAGGSFNTASDPFATVAGGRDNTASNQFATIAGGRDNTASNEYATIGGGRDNNASNEYATVPGGRDNSASDAEATVGGGRDNTASGLRSTVPGGFANTASESYAFAAGRRAKAIHQGAFVWADSQDADVESTRDDEFTARATGGVRFLTSLDGAGVALPPGGGAWSTLSDRASKANISVVDGRPILEALASMPVSTWNYRSQDDSIRHIGPTAQDFAEAFGFGGDPRRISTVDADGVALAAIQGLYQMMQEQDARIADLESRLAALDGGEAPKPSSGFSLGGNASTLAGALLMAGLVVSQGLRLRGRRRG